MLLNEENQKRVARAIAAIERDTDAEVVTVLARQADDYRYIPMMWAALLSLLVPLALAFMPVGLDALETLLACLLYTSPSPRDATLSRMPSSA